MSDQGQHRISQVYLKQFGFPDKNNKWWISTWKLGDEYTGNRSIKSFSKELNIFDIPTNDYKIKRTFENFSGILETFYPTIIKEIDINHSLSEKNLSVLIQFMTNLLCRVVPFRAFINSLLKSKKRDYFLSEITYYHEDKGEKLIIDLNKVKVDYQLNIIIFSVWYYFVNTLTSSNFDYVILKDYQNRGWITSDNPVIMINNINDNTLISKETEIYFPISKDYCLYIDNRCYNRSNSMRGKKNEELIDIDEDTQLRIYDLIWRNAYQYVINPTDIGRLKLSK